MKSSLADCLHVFAQAGKVLGLKHEAVRIIVRVKRRGVAVGEKVVGNGVRKGLL